MKKILLFFTLFSIIYSGIKAQEIVSENQSDTLLIQINSLTKQIYDLEQALELTNRSLYSSRIDHVKSVDRQDLINDSIKKQLMILNQSLNNNIASLDQKLSESAEKSESNFSELKRSLSTNTIYWILGTSFAIVLAILLFFLLRRYIKKNDQKTMKQLQSTRKSLEEEGIRLDNKLIELLEKQLAIVEVTPKSGSSEEIDHSLALKVADEIVRIQRNLSMMDEEVRGKKQLSASVERIRSNFEANGYEIVDMLNKSYHEGMNASVTFREDDSIETGQKVITRIIKPQVNFKGVMIQTAQIEVSQNI